jgi:hemolysin D
MRRSEEIEFLPAAVEVAEAPATPAARLSSIVIAGIVVVAAAWSWVSRVDIVATASGRTVPAGHVKTVQPLEIGTVRAIHIRDGQAVRRGDVLIELDATASVADRDRLARELAAARLDVARLAALAGSSAFIPPIDATVGAELLAQQQALFHAQRQEHEARLAAIDSEMMRRRADRAATQATVMKLERTVPLVRDREQAYGTLARQGFVARLTHVELEQLLIEQEQELAAQRHRLDEASAQLEGLAGQRRQIEAEHDRLVLGQLAEAETRAAGLAQELIKADRRHGLHRLGAPIDGIVQQLAVHTVGGVVTPAQSLMTIVPSTKIIEVEALVLNRDVGFVRAGLSAEIKLETFPFTRYGTVPGHVVHVAADAVSHERLGLIYPVRVALERRAMNVDGRHIELAPGMNVTVEIQIGQRRVLEYVLGPLLRYTSESLRER